MKIKKLTIEGIHQPVSFFILMDYMVLFQFKYHKLVTGGENRVEYSFRYGTVEGHSEDLEISGCFCLGHDDDSLDVPFY